MKPCHFIAKRFKHLADLTVAAFIDSDFHKGFVFGLIKKSDLTLLTLDVIDPNSFFQFCDLFRLDQAVNSYFIDLGNMKTGFVLQMRMTRAKILMMTGLSTFMNAGMGKILGSRMEAIPFYRSSRGQLIPD